MSAHKSALGLDPQPSTLGFSAASLPQVEPTAKGRELVAKTFERHAAAMEKTINLSKEERLNLLELLKKFGKGAEHRS